MTALKKSRTVFIIGGPNGAGKSTVAKRVLSETLGLAEFVNADAIAAGLAGFDLSRVEFAAGRLMIQRLHELANGQASFAFESTLSSRTFAPWLQRLVAAGWRVQIAYVWVRKPEISVRRVRLRVSRGGHHVPEDVVRRRYARSAKAFWTLYRPIAANWQVYDNSGQSPRLIAAGELSDAVYVYDTRRFEAFMELVNAP